MECWLVVANTDASYLEGGEKVWGRHEIGPKIVTEKLVETY